MTEEQVKAEFARKADGRLHNMMREADYIAEAVAIMVEIMAKAIAEKTECRFEVRADPNYPGNPSIAPAVAFCTMHNSYRCPPATTT